MKNRIKNLYMYLGLSLVVSCGGDDSSGSSSSAPSKPIIKILGEVVRGSAVAENNSVSSMAQKLVMLYDHNTDLSHTSIIDNAGLYTLRDIDLTHTFSLYIFSAEMKLESMFTVAQDGSLYYKFSILKTSLPLIQQEGERLYFKVDDPNAISPVNVSEADENADSVIDGFSSLIASASLTSRTPYSLYTPETSGQDTDEDLIDNNTDHDIDGDGVINCLDHDDDNDGVNDIFDQDDNANGITDERDNFSDAHFDNLIDHVSIQVEENANAKLTYDPYMNIQVKIQEGTKPAYIGARTSTTMQNSSFVETLDSSDPTGQSVILSAWNTRLKDDGQSNDGQEGDGIYGIRLKLSALPSANEVIFIQYAYDKKDLSKVIEVAYNFPPFSSNKATSLNGSKTTGVFSLTGASPFGDDNPFMWTINTFDSDEKLIQSFGPFSSSETEKTIATHRLTTVAKTSLLFQSINKTDARPARVIRTPKISLN